MKTKLLKKIRKEWAIYRIDSVGNNTTLKYYNKYFTLPFYNSSKVTGDRRGFETDHHQTFQEAKDRILEEVKSKYEPIFRKDKCTPRITKVWHIHFKAQIRHYY